MFYPLTHGFTPFDTRPLGSEDDIDFATKGIKIGDVVRRGQRGDLEFTLFNITEAANSPRNRNRVPKGFVPLILEPEVDFVYKPAMLQRPSIWGATSDPSKKWHTNTIQSNLYAPTNSNVL